MTVTHTDVEYTGRVTEVEILAYPHDHERWSHDRYYIGRRHKKGYLTQNQAMVQFNDGRNAFAWEVLKSILSSNVRENRGGTMIFAKTLEHAQRFSEHAAREGKQLEVYHSGLQPGEQTRILAGLKAGTITAVVTTDTLSTGLDAPRVWDVMDITGMKELTTSIQRAGRAVRSEVTGKVARMHIIEDTREELSGMSKSKIYEIAKHFGVRAERVNLTPSVHTDDLWVRG